MSDSGSGDEKMLAQMAESDIVETLVDNAIAVQNLEKMDKTKTARNVPGNNRMNIHIGFL